MQTEAFQGGQTHNSFVCYAIETSCSLLSQYLLPNGMCALLLLLLKNTRLVQGLVTSPLYLSPLLLHHPPSPALLRPSLPFHCPPHPRSLANILDFRFHPLILLPSITPSPGPMVHYHICSIRTPPSRSRKKLRRKLHK